MLIAIGIYQVTPYSYKKLQSVPAMKLGYNEFNGLANFENNTLPTLNHFEKHDINIINVDGRCEFHYIKKIDPDTIMVIVSKTRLECTRERPELYYLQYNIELAYRYPERTRTNLQDILNNPLGYIARDILIDGVQKMAEATREELLKTIDAMIERGGKIEVLLDDTKRLAHAAGSFQIETKKINRGYCC